MAAKPLGWKKGFLLANITADNPTEKLARGRSAEPETSLNGNALHYAMQYRLAQSLCARREYVIVGEDQQVQCSHCCCVDGVSFGEPSRKVSMLSSATSCSLSCSVDGRGAPPQELASADGLAHKQAYR
eukprot:1179498-Amphidinium_carterae.1